MATGMQSAPAMETAVPTLKVMRLRKPNLHMPTAGTLQSTCLLGTAMSLPDSFGVIHVGETFTAYLGALNVSKSLKVTSLTFVAQLQTPSRRWHLASSFDEGNAAGGVEVPPEQGIDTIVSHALEELGQHILRVDVGYAGSDGSSKSFRKFYRFQVSNPLVISELTFRAGEACCFVSISLENKSTETNSGLTICESEFTAANGLVAERVGKQEGVQPGSTATALFDESGRLESGACVRYLFKIESTQPRGIAAGDELGKAIFTWRKACGEMGRMASSQVICPQVSPLLDPNDPVATMEGRGNPFVVHVKGSSLSVDVATAAAARAANANMDRNALDQLLPLTLEPVDPPQKMTLGVPHQVQFLIINHSDKGMTIQLQFHLDSMKGLSVCGSSFKNLEEIPGNGGSTTVGVRFVPLAEGLLPVQGASIVDLSTGREFPQPPLFHVLVEPEVERQ